MKGKASRQIDLSMMQVMVDMHVADDCIKVSEGLTAKMAKPFKGQAGYHLQQAAEKMIKMQIYSSGKPLDYSKLYKHSLDDLMNYAKSIGISLTVPRQESRGGRRKGHTGLTRGKTEQGRGLPTTVLLPSGKVREQNDENGFQRHLMC